MSLRYNPLRRSCENLLFNLRQYKSRSSRPMFRSNNHPFCTNSQLMDASYTNWLMRTSKDIPSRLFNSLVEYQEQHESRHGNDNSQNNKFNTLPPSAMYIHQVSQQLAVPSHITVDDNRQKTNNNSIHSSVLSHLKRNDFKSIAEVLSKYKCSENEHLPNNVLMEILEKGCEVASETEGHTKIETPRHTGIKTLNEHTRHHNLYRRIPHLYQICQLYESRGLSHKRFQEHYIWLCYHMDDIDTLQRLVYLYLRNDEYNSKTLSYLMGGFILSYEVEFAKNLFSSIIGMSKQLSSNLLESVIYQFIKVDAIFNNITSVFYSWVEADNCEVPSIEAISLMLRECYKLGSKEEIEKMQKFVRGVSLSGHHSVRSIKVQNDIIRRNPFSLQKVITEKDLSEINLIAESIGNNQDVLREFYHDFLHFFACHSNLKMMQYIILQMKSKGVAFDKECFDIVIKFYGRNEKFLTLFTFITHTACVNNPQSGLAFDHKYVKNLYDTYIQTYPYHAMEFHQSFHKWVNNQRHFSTETKSLILGNCQIVELQSHLTPHNLKNSEFQAKKKYDASQWEEVKWITDPLTGKPLRYRSQIDFRINKGLRDVMRKGLRPDYTVLEKTFRRSGPQGRSVVYDILINTRLHKYKSRLDVLGLQVSDASAADLLKFVDSNESKLNSNHKILLSRMLMNKRLYDTTRQILSQVTDAEMSDKQKMVKFNFGLRNELGAFRFDRMCNMIEDFPINDIVLSPYISSNCRYIEKKLSQKLRVIKRQLEKLTENVDNVEVDESMVNHLCEQKASLKATLIKIQGLIGDIDLRLDQDKLDLKGKVREMFHFFDKWIAQAADSTDQRYL